MKRKKRGAKDNPQFWKTFFLMLVILIALFTITNLLASKLDFGNEIAVIPIQGIISTTGVTSMFKTGTSSEQILKYIEKAKKDGSVKGVIFEINSPGGTTVASSEIADAIKKLEKPTTALIKDSGTSGAYWIASACDKIVAHPLSITGSLGVIGSYLELSDLFEEYGITYQRLVTGKYKDMGSQYKELTGDERKLFQEKLDKIHTYFVNEVTKNRNKDLSAIADGSFYLGIEALKIGLIDYLGDKELAIDITEEQAGIEKSKLVRYEEKAKLTDILGKLFSEFGFYVGSGIGSILLTEAKNSNLEIKL